MNRRKLQGCLNGRHRPLGRWNCMSKPLVLIVEKLLARLRVTQRRLTLTQGGCTPTRRPLSTALCGLHRQLRLFGLGRAEADAHRVQASLPPLPQRQEGTHPHLHHPEYLGLQLGQRHRFSPGIHGHAAQKTGAVKWFSPVHPDPHRRGLPYAEGGVSRRLFRAKAP